MSFLKPTLAGVTAATIFMGAGMGAAQTTSEDRFALLDTDGDGYVTVEEIEASQAERFANTDADSDGFLTSEELLAAIEAAAEANGREINSARLSRRIERMINRMDEDGDGQISATEMAARDASKMIERVDSDGDGQISATEAEDMRASRQERREQKREKKENKRSKDKSEG